MTTEAGSSKALRWRRHERERRRKCTDWDAERPAQQHVVSALALFVFCEDEASRAADGACELKPRSRFDAWKRQILYFNQTLSLSA